MHLTLFLGALPLLFLLNCQCQAAPTTFPPEPSTTYVSAFKQALSSEEDVESSTTEEPRVEQNDELESSGQEDSSLARDEGSKDKSDSTSSSSSTSKSVESTSPSTESKSIENTSQSTESKSVETILIKEKTIEGSGEDSSGDKSSSSESTETVSGGLIPNDKSSEEGSGQKESKSSSSEENKSGSVNENSDEEGSGQDKSLSSEEHTKTGTNGEKLTLKNFTKDLLHKIAADDKLILQEQIDNTKNTDSDDDDSTYDDSDDDGDDDDSDDDDSDDSDETEKSQSDRPTIEKSISADSPIPFTKLEKNKKISSN